MPADTTIDPEFLDILVCPITRSPLTVDNGCLVAQIGGLRYPVKDGIPILLPESADLPDGIATLEEFKRRYADQIPA